jgi:hypothetical protein
VKCLMVRSTSSDAWWNNLRRWLELNGTTVTCLAWLEMRNRTYNTIAYQPQRTRLVVAGEDEGEAPVAFRNGMTWSANFGSTRGSRW